MPGYDYAPCDEALPPYKPRVMTAQDYSVSHCSGEHLFLLGDMLSYNKDWPAIVQHQGETFRFVANEPMPNHAVGNFHGYARYEKYDPYRSGACKARCSVEYA